MKKEMNSRHVSVKDPFIHSYSYRVQELMLDATNDTTDYLVLEYLVQQAWKHDCDLAEVDLTDLAKHYELSVRKVRSIRPVLHL